MDDGFTTRAVRAATRVLKEDRRPLPVPIHGALAGDLRADIDVALVTTGATSAAAVDAPAATPATA